MDYAKYAYIKTKELEETASTINQSGSTTTVEFVNPILNMQVTSSATISLGQINLLGASCFQLQLICLSNTTGDVAVEILVDSVPVVSEERSIASGENQLIITKAYTPAKVCNVNLAARITVLSNNYSCKITSCSLVMWGAISEVNVLNSVDIRGLTLGENVLVSYTESGKIYAATTSVEEKSLLASDFSLVANGISHCYAKSKKDDEVYFFRVDSIGNLYYSISDNGAMGQETRLDIGVSWVSARVCPNSYSEDIIVCYIKDGKPLYRCMTNHVMGSASAFTLPVGSYSKVEVADAPESQKVYVICTHTNGSNYILMSQEESDLSTFVEQLLATYAIIINRYVNLRPFKDLLVDNLSAEISLQIFKNLINFDALLSGITENLQAKATIEVEDYKIVPEINYILTVDQILDANVNGIDQKIKYGGDCADYTPAAFDFESHTLQDNGWLQRWPFNEIKPCLINSGVVIGYLDPNDYSKFIDGTDADIYSGENDVMIEFPKVYYKFDLSWDGSKNLIETKQNEYVLSICNKPKDGYACNSHFRQGVEYDKIYIGAYDGVVKDNTIYCCSGKSGGSEINHEEILLTMDQLKGSRYTTLNFHVTTLIEILFLLLFKDTRSLYCYGLGYYNMYGTPTNGVLDKAGLFYSEGNTKNTTGIKIFGLENITMGMLTLVDGVLIDSDLNFLVIDNKDPDQKLSVLGTGYTNAFTLQYEVNGALAMNYADTQTGFLPFCIYKTGNDNGYYASKILLWSPAKYYYLKDDPNLPNMIMSYGGSKSDQCGIFSLQSCYTYTRTNSDFGERLICYPISCITK